MWVARRACPAALLFFSEGKYAALEWGRAGRLAEFLYFQEPFTPGAPVRRRRRRCLVAIHRRDECLALIELRIGGQGQLKSFTCRTNLVLSARRQQRPEYGLLAARSRFALLIGLSTLDRTKLTGIRRPGGDVLQQSYAALPNAL